MEQVLSHHLVTIADAYVAATGASLATVGERAGGDWRFFDKVRGGCLNWRIRTYDRAVAWFSANWPAGVAWPDGIDRPVSVDETEEAA